MEMDTQEELEVAPVEAEDDGGLYVDAGRVLILVGDPQTGKGVPMPLPAVFEQLFGILGDIDRRLMAIEEEKTKSRIITV